MSLAELGLSSENLQKGEQLFRRECIICHGEKGSGNGKAAFYLFPKPSDLTMGVFKIRSTPSGEPPTDEDLFRVLTNGIPGSAMPAFRNLSESERWSLVYYVKKIADISEVPEDIIKVSDEPDVSSSIMKKGKELYSKMRCWDCHGVEGKGDGPSSQFLSDDLGYPDIPNDLAEGIYKGGSDNSDIYLRITAGMDGSPMPSYQHSMNEEERWALVKYIKSMSGDKNIRQPSGGDIAAKRVNVKIRTDSIDPFWDKISFTEIPLMLTWQRKKRIDMLSVKAVHNGTDIFFYLEWKDSSPQDDAIRYQDFADAVAVQFPLSMSKHTPFSMGEKNRPVNIWYWRAGRQMNVKQSKGIQNVYKRMISDAFYPTKGSPPEKKEGIMPYRIDLSEAKNSSYMIGKKANNLPSGSMKLSSVEDLNSEGFGTLKSQGAEGQNVRGYGIWHAGRWSVVMARSLDSSDEMDSKFKPGKNIHVAFAVWDGSQRDRNGENAVTIWYNLKIEK